MKHDIIEINSKKITRESGIELLKIIGIILIIISHVTQTLETKYGEAYGYIDYYINLSQPTTSFTIFLVVLLRYSGSLGNIIFFMCSAFFLLNKNETNVKKIFRMISDIWIISIIWLITTLIIRNNVIEEHFIYESLTPVIKQNNWYLTAYIIFCFIFPFLNIIIRNIDQKKHLCIIIVLFITNILFSFYKSFPYTSTMTLWITIYFIIAYFKLYGKKICESNLINIIGLCIGIIGHILGIVIINYLAVNNMNDNLYLTMRNSSSNIYLLLIGFSLLNLFNNIKIKNIYINYISSLSMLIYIIHENILFRYYFRPLIWNYIYHSLGYDLIVLWIILYAMVLFVGSFIVASIYKLLLEKTIHKISDFIYTMIMKAFDFLRNTLMRIIQ